MKPLKIAVWHNLPSGGGKRALHGHVEGLVKRGHTVEVWCPPTADRSYLPLGEITREHVVPLNVPQIPRRTRVADILAPYREAGARIAALDRHCAECAAQINRGGFDILFANSCVMEAVSSIGRQVTLPAVAYLQEPNRHLYEARPRLPWLALPAEARPWSPGALKRSLRDLVAVQALRTRAREEAANVHAFDRILVNSFFSREGMLRTFGVDARVCYLGIDTRLFQNRMLPRQHVVVGVGAFHPHKNIEFVIQAIARMAEPRPRLVWIGNMVNTGYRRQLEEFAAAGGVEFVPHTRVSDAELVEHLGTALCMAYAPRLEPFGYAPLEANACGTPVVAVAEGGVRETIVDGVNGLLVDGDPQSMATALERLAADRQLAAGLGRRGAELVAERWSLEAAVERLETHLVETAEAAGRSAGGCASISSTEPSGRRPASATRSGPS